MSQIFHVVQLLNPSGQQRTGDGCIGLPFVRFYDYFLLTSRSLVQINRKDIRSTAAEEIAPFEELLLYQ